MILYSPSLNQFFFGGDLPEEGALDVVEVTMQKYVDLMGVDFAPGPDGQPVPDILGLRARRIDEIIFERDRRQDQGGTLVGDKWFHSDAKSRIQQLALDRLAAGGMIPPGLQWKTMDGSFTLMTNELAPQVFMGSVLSDMALFAYAEGLKAAVNASTDPKQVDITTGWPTAFTDL